MSFSVSRSAFLFATVLWLASTDASAAVTKDECVDANTTAQLLRREGKLRAAREQFEICIDKSCPRIVRMDCIQRLDELESAQATVIFDVKDAAGNEVRDVKVSVDGRRLAERLDGTPLAVDPGEHEFTFEVAAEPPVTRRFGLLEGEKGRRENIVVGDAAHPSAAVSVTESPAGHPAPFPGACKKDDECASGSCSDGKCSEQKAAGETCDNDDQCMSGACANGKCTEGGARKSTSNKGRKIWVGITGSFDLIGLPAAENVCVLGNASGYSCVDPTTGLAFPADPAANMTIKTGSGATVGDAVAGGLDLSFSSTRLALSFDYAFGMNVLVGARAGYVLFTAPASAFPPIHLEARVSLLLGKDALASTTAPMLLLAAGAGEFDASFPVTVQRTSGGTTNATAWITAGPLFGVAGAGVRFLLGPTIAATVALKGEGAFGGSAGFLFGVAPEVGMQLGL